ncbi:hypothetical protein TWF718_003662 [Orbilia javanica]|uniref:Uncharacterized protein n=1 Tax=Orbilia javanica TaxID=47235 RepID=A0AAN8RF13_9PEZI
MVSRQLSPIAGFRRRRNSCISIAGDWKSDLTSLSNIPIKFYRGITGKRARSVSGGEAASYLMTTRAKEPPTRGHDAIVILSLSEYFPSGKIASRDTFVANLHKTSDFVFGLSRPLLALLSKSDGVLEVHRALMQIPFAMPL